MSQNVQALYYWHQDDELILYKICMSKQKHANPLVTYIIGLRELGLNLYEKDKAFSHTDEETQRTSSIWLYKKQYFIEGIARENAYMGIAKEMVGCYEQPQDFLTLKSSVLYPSETEATLSLR